MYDSHTKLKCLASVSFYLESFPKSIIHYWFMASSAKKKIYDFEKLKHLGDGFP